jgi:restriction endonuclease S subunit
MLVLKILLENIAKLQSGLYTQPDIQADTLYLQAVHFDQYGEFNPEVKPQLKRNGKIEKHLLQPADVLFAAKGLNNFAVVYEPEWGPAVASSSFIILRLNVDQHWILPHYLAWYLTNHPHVQMFHKQLGTTIPSISIEKLSKLEVVFPAPGQQQRIVHIQQLRNHEKQLVFQLQQQKDYLIKQTLLNAATQ